jgi:CRP/FNR family transcriptional regulator
LILNEHLSRIHSLFPCMGDITAEDWNQDGINVIQIDPNYIIEEERLLEYVFMILDGVVRMYKISANGREFTLYRIHGGECCPSISSLLGESEFEASACVETAGIALIIPRKIFREWIDTYPVFRQFIFKSFAKRIQMLSSLVDSISFKTIRERVSEFLFQLANQTVNSDSLRVTHHSLSVELGTAREVISRVLKELENEHIIKLSRGSITIIDRNALKR